MYSGMTPPTVRSLPVMAAAVKKVAAAMRSGITRCSQPVSLFTPSMEMVLFPAPRILAPQELRKSARSVISGSLAALLTTVFPLARHAAMMMFSVAPTLGKERLMAAPWIPCGTVQSGSRGPR